MSKKIGYFVDEKVNYTNLQRLNWKFYTNTLYKESLPYPYIPFSILLSRIQNVLYPERDKLGFVRFQIRRILSL